MNATVAAEKGKKKKKENEKKKSRKEQELKIVEHYPRLSVASV